MRIFPVLCFFFSALSPALLMSIEFQQPGAKVRANNYLKNRAPYFMKNPGDPHEKEIPEFNYYSISMENPDGDTAVFSSLTGLSLSRTDFVASWYIFGSAGNIPESVTEILNLVNRQKPVYFSQLAKIEDHWSGQAELPYLTLEDGSLVFVYISMIARSGILIPIASQSFYRDAISGVYRRNQATVLNMDLLRFWYDLGYFRYNAAGVPTTTQ